MGINAFVSKLEMVRKLIFTKGTEIPSIGIRSLDRYRRIGRSAIAALASRGVSILTGILVIPLLLSYLGPDRFGLWMVITNFVTFLNFADFGLGVGLQNSLTESHGRDDKVNPRSYVSSALLILSLIFLCFTLVAIYVLPVMPLHKLIKVQSDLAAAELLPTSQAFMIIFGFGFITTLTERIANAYQEGYFGSIWLALGRISAFIGVFICVYLGLGLPALIIVYIGTPKLFSAIGGILLIRKKPWMTPSLAALSKKAIVKMFKIGATGVGAKLAYMLLNTTPLLIISNGLGAAAVVPYAIAQKLLSTSGILLQTLITPFWPAYGEAATRNDWDWVRKNFYRTLQLAAMIQLPIFLVIGTSGQWIIEIWTNDLNAIPTWSLLMACNIWYLIYMWTSVASMLLNGLNRMKGQATFGLLIACSGFFAGYWYSFHADDVASIIWVMLLAGMVPRGLALLIEVALVLSRARKMVMVKG